MTLVLTASSGKNSTMALFIAAAENIVNTSQELKTVPLTSHIENLSLSSLNRYKLPLVFFRLCHNSNLANLSTQKPCSNFSSNEPVLQ